MKLKAEVIAAFLVALTLVASIIPRSMGAQTIALTADEPMLTVTANAVVRAWPVDSAEVLGSLPARSSIPAAGKLDTGEWWMIPYPTAPGGMGWVASNVVRPNAAAQNVPVYVVLAPTPEPAPTPTSVVCLPGAKYVSDVTIPDGTIVMPGQPFRKTWRVKNTGTCAWDAGVALGWIGGFRLAGQASVAVPYTPPGGTADVGISLYGPNQPGRYQGIWQMANADGARFGDRLTVVVGVQGAVPSPPPPPPTAAPPPMPGPYINFSADRTGLNGGECTTLRWDVEGVQAIFLEYDGKSHGVTGHETKEVCPNSNRTYRLVVVMLDGNRQVRDIQINVNSPLPSASIEFKADRTKIRVGQCTTVWWEVRDARRVRFDGKDVNHNDSREVCPRKATTYRLQVENLDGQKRDRSVTIEVSQAQPR